MQIWNRVKSILFGLMTVVAAMLGFEALGRVITTVTQEVERNKSYVPENWFVFSPDVGWERKPNYRGPVFRDEREFGRAGYLAVDTVQVGDDVKPKVLFIGDSNTFGFGVPTKSTFVEVVDSLLPQASAINLGVNGYTSYQGRMVFSRYATELKPSIAVVSFNFNDRRAVFMKDQVDSKMKFQRFSRQGNARALRIFLENTHVYKNLRTMLTSANLLPPDPQTTRIDSLLPRCDKESYRHNLTMIAEEARSKRIALVFILLKDNPIQCEQLNRGIEFFGKSEYDMAIGYLRVAVEMGNMFSDLARLYLARAYENTGLVERAEEALIPTFPFNTLHGGRPVLLDREYNEIMREVASHYDIDLIDAGTVLDADLSVYIDCCHFNERGHYRVAQLVAERLRKLLKRQSHQL